MGFLNKLKNVFFEEEEVEVEEKVKKEKPIAKKVELPKKEKKVEEVEIEEEDEEIEAGETYTPKEKNNSFKFPVLLEDDLIEEEMKEPVKEEAKRSRRTAIEEEPDYSDDIVENDIPYDNSYTRDLNSADYSLHERTSTEKGFRPSPIISPIYGVLDKNYTKDEIRDKKETHPTFSFTNDKLDLDSVRRKAYGNDIAYDIENDIEEDYNDRDSYEEETTLDMTDTNMTPVVEKVTVGDAEEYFADLGLEYNVDYKDHSKEKMTKRRSRMEKEEIEPNEEESSFSEEEFEPTSVYEEENNQEVEDNNSFDEIDNEEIKEDVEEEPVKEEKKRTRSKTVEETEEVEIEDNLFDLIDSMYDEGE